MTEWGDRKMDVIITLYERSGWGHSSLEIPENFIEFIAWSNKKLMEIPEEFRASAKIEFDTDNCRYDDSNDLSIEITYRRPETSEELLERLEEEEAAREKREHLEYLKERATYEALKKKFEVEE